MPKPAIKTVISILTMIGLMALLLVGVAQTQNGRGQGGDLLDSTNAGFLNVIVVLDESAAPGRGTANRAAAAEVARSFGVAPNHVYGTALFGFAARIPEQRLDTIRNDPRVVYVNIDELNRIPTPPEFAQKPPRCSDDSNGRGCSTADEPPAPPPGEEIPWGVLRIGAVSNPNKGAGVDVYVIDSGIDSDHPDLLIGNSIAIEKCRPSKKCAFDWDDDNGHGTHVAGIIGALDNSIGVVGVAPEVTLHAVKVLDKQGTAFTSEIIAGINWVAEEVIAQDEDEPVNRVPVVANISIGGTGSKTGECNQSGYIGTNAYQEAMCNAAHVGVIFAVSAGNQGIDAETRRPASYDDTSIAVSATLQVVDEDGVVIGDGWPGWSNWGDGGDGGDGTFDPDWTGHGTAPVAIAAPGVSILSTWNGGGTNTISGTSMAAPHVAGAIALYLEESDPTPAADYYAFLDARTALLSNAESTSGFIVQGNNNPHDEYFLDVDPPPNNSPPTN